MQCEFTWTLFIYRCLFVIFIFFISKNTNSYVFLVSWSNWKNEHTQGFQFSSSHFQIVTMSHVVVLRCRMYRDKARGPTCEDLGKSNGVAVLFCLGSFIVI